MGLNRMWTIRSSREPVEGEIGEIGLERELGVGVHLGNTKGKGRLKGCKSY